MAKMGRPLKRESAAYHNMSFRLTEAEYKRLKAYASEANATITEVLQEGLEMVYQKKQKNLPPEPVMIREENDDGKKEQEQRSQRRNT